MQLRLVTALSSIASLAVAAKWAPSYCQLEQGILSAVRQDPNASGFCCHYLGIQTSTITSTATHSIPATTVFVGQTTPTATFTSTVVGTESTFTSQAFTTVTTSATEPIIVSSGTTTTTFALNIPATCLSSATTFTPTQVISTLKKRNVATEVTPECLKPLQPTIISELCSCLSIPTPKTTTIVTRTVTSGTVSSPSPVDIIATSIVTSTVTPVTTITITNTLSGPTVTVPAATTTTLLPTTQPTLAGLNWYFYNSSYSNNGSGKLGNGGFNPSVFNNNPDYLYSGNNLGDVNYFQTIDFGPAPGGNTNCILPNGLTEDCEHVAVVLQGFLYATQGAGAYTLSTPAFTGHYIDDIFYVWSGDNAYNSLDSNDADYAAYYHYANGSVTYNLASGEFLPISMMWVNTAAGGEASVQITTPDGTTHNDTSGFFLPPCSDSAFAP